MTVAEVAQAWGMSAQRARVLLSGIQPLHVGHGGQGTGSRYALVDIERVAQVKLFETDKQKERWQGRFEVIRRRRLEATE